MADELGNLGQEAMDRIGRSSPSIHPVASELQERSCERQRIDEQCECSPRPHERAQAEYCDPDRSAPEPAHQQLLGAARKGASAVQGDKLRVSGKKRDDLQAVISMLKETDIGLPLQYENFRD